MVARSDGWWREATASPKAVCGGQGRCATAVDGRQRALHSFELAPQQFELIPQARFEFGDPALLRLDRVVENKGTAGVDALTVADFKAYLQQHWPTIKGRPPAATYQPHPVRRVDIPKPQGGVRTLGIPGTDDPARKVQLSLSTGRGSLRRPCTCCRARHGPRTPMWTKPRPLAGGQASALPASRARGSRRRTT
jgi:hypothetical protein